MTSAVSLSDVIGSGFEQPNSKVTRLTNASHLTTRLVLRVRGLKTTERKGSGCKRRGFKGNESEGKKSRMVKVSPKELMADSRLD